MNEASQPKLTDAHFSGLNRFRLRQDIDPEPDQRVKNLLFCGGRVQFIFFTNFEQGDRRHGRYTSTDLLKNRRPQENTRVVQDRFV